MPLDPVSGYDLVDPTFSNATNVTTTLTSATATSAGGHVRVTPAAPYGYMRLSVRAGEANRLKYIGIGLQSVAFDGTQNTIRWGMEFLASGFLKGRFNGADLGWLGSIPTFTATDVFDMVINGATGQVTIAKNGVVVLTSTTLAVIGNYPLEVRAAFTDSGGSFTNIAVAVAPAWTTGDIHVAPDATVYGNGSLSSPIDLTQMMNGARPYSPGDTILLRGGEYPGPVTCRLVGNVNNRVRIQAFPEELARFSPNGWIFASESAYVDFVGQTYGYSTGVSGIEVYNDDPHRFSAVNGSDPDLSYITAGTLSNNTFTVTPAQPHRFINLVGLTFQLYNGTTPVWSSIIDSHSLRELTLVDSYGGTVALGTFQAKVLGHTGYRDSGGAIISYGENIRIINPIFHDTGDGLSIWEQSKNSQLYGGIGWACGWNAIDRDHGSLIYSQNNNTTQSSEMKFRHFMGLNSFAGTARLYGSSGFADNAEWAYCGLTNGSFQEHLHHDLDPAVKATGNVSGTTFTATAYEVGTAFVVQSLIRIKHPSGGRDFFTRINAVVGNTVTLRDACPFTQNGVNATITSFGTTQYNLLVGSGNGTRPSSDINVHHLRTFHPQNGLYGGFVLVGYVNNNRNATFRDNYIVGAVDLRSWEDVTSEDNTVVTSLSNTNFSGDLAMSFSRAATSNTRVFNRSNYFLRNFGALGAFKESSLVGARNSFAQWQGLGYDTAGSATATLPTSNVVFVDAQDGAIGQQGRAHIYIYNWENLTSVTVDLSTSGLVNGQDFEIRDGEDFLGTPVVTGTFNAGSPTVSIPMTGTAAAEPVGWQAADLAPLASTKPVFGSFVLLPYEIVAPVGAPNSPSSFAATQVGNSRIDLTWSLTGPTATAVVLEYKRTDQTTWTTVNLGAVTSHSLNLVAGSSYNFRVAASNGAGTSLFTLLNRTLTAVFHFGTRPTVSA